MGNVQQEGPSTQKDKNADLEDIVRQMANNTNQFMTETRTNFQNQAAQIRSLEV